MNLYQLRSMSGFQLPEQVFLIFFALNKVKTVRFTQSFQFSLMFKNH